MKAFIRSILLSPYFWCMCVVAACALYVRIDNIDKRSISWDERRTVEHVVREGNYGWWFFKSNPQHVAYHLVNRLTWPLAEVFVDSPECSDATMRMPNAFIGMFGVIALYFLGKRLCSRGTGLIAAALVCVSWWHTWHCQDARYYPLMFLLSAIIGILTWRTLAGEWFRVVTSDTKRGRAIRIGVTAILWVVVLWFALRNHPMAFLGLACTGVGAAFWLYIEGMARYERGEKLRPLAGRAGLLLCVVCLGVACVIPAYRTFFTKHNVQRTLFYSK